jgi:hypothetical protein
MDAALKRKVLKQLARTSGDVAQAALAKEADAIKVSLQTESNYDEILSGLESLDTIGYRVHANVLDILSAFLARIDGLKLTYPKIEGYSEEKQRSHKNQATLIVKALEVLEHVRYHQPDTVLKIFFGYSAHSDASISKQALHGIEALAGFDIDIFYANDKGWPGLGWEPQEKVLEVVESFADADRTAYFAGILVACEQILSPTIEGTNWTYNSVKFRSGPVPAMDGVVGIRKRALVILEKMYELSKNTEQKKTVLATMNVATRTPHMGSYGDDVWKMIEDDTASVLRFMKSRVQGEELPVIQKIEHDAYFFMRRGQGTGEISALALQIKEALDNNPEYQIYKVLIGFEGVFDEWRVDEEKGAEAFDRESSLRERKTQEFAQSVTSENFDTWKARILSYASVRSNDLATFPYFGRFLEQLGKSSPTLAIRLLEENSEQLDRFFVSLLVGAWDTNERPRVREIALNWVRNGSHLFTLARLLEHVNELDTDLLYVVLDEAKTRKDCDAVNQVISTVSAHYGKTNVDLTKEFFLPALQFLTAEKNSGWIFDFWYRQLRKEMLAAMNRDQYQIILDNLVLLPTIDYHAEQILRHIGEREPEQVLQFFCARIDLESDDDVAGKYDAVPYSLRELAKPLSSVPEQAVEIVRKTYDGNYGMFIFRGARLIKNIFPNFDDNLAKQLIELVRSKNKGDILFVLAILRGYEGQVFIHNICKEIVKATPVHSSMRNEIDIALHNTGVVSGEYGFVNAYQRKIEEIRPWLDDPNPEVQAFALGYIERLGQRIVSERQRADEDIVLRKHQYGDDDSGDVGD